LDFIGADGATEESVGGPLDAKGDEEAESGGEV
jgi:hypothetical protein